jgi:3-dehydroquinate synthase
MKRIPVHLGDRSYGVLVGPGALEGVAMLAGGHDRVAVVTQDAVARHWGDRVVRPLTDAGAKVETFTMGDGEAAKSLATVETLCRRFATWGLLRGDVIVALGGGVVGDTAGFAAATYHRGIRYLQAPTTLLAQVDAAIGGKTAVNLPEGKNLIGAFHQPAAVLADTDTLATLPEREYRSGLGEVAKYALMGDDALARQLEREAAAGIARRDANLLAEVVAACAATKAGVVEDDEYERTGRRARLNYGHTLAHALETLAGYELLHGEAVAVGLVFAAELAASLERITPARADEHRHLLAALDLPTVAPPGLAARDLLPLMQRDKKSSGGLTFILPGADGLERVDDPDAGALGKAFAAVGID